jgi:hypothetical protein
VPITHRHAHVERLSQVRLLFSVPLGRRLNRFEHPDLDVPAEAAHDSGEGRERVAAVRVCDAKHAPLVVLAAGVLGHDPVQDESVKIVQEEEALRHAKRGVKVVEQGLEDMVVQS